MRGISVKMCGHVKTVHFGHRDVGDDDGGAARDRQRLHTARVSSYNHPKSLGFEGELQQFKITRVVINDQNLRSVHAVWL